MVALTTAASVFKIGYGIGNLLFGKKKKDPTPASNIMSQLKGVREGAEKYGFNPLTVLQNGQTGGAMGASGGGSAPLASIDMITGALRDIDDVRSGDQARRRQADQLEIDLARLKLDQARAGVVGIAAPRQRAASGTFGHQTGTVVQSNSRTVPAKLSGSDDSRTRSTLPLYTTAGGHLDTHSKSSDAEAYEARYGEVGGEIHGLDALIYDYGKAARLKFQAAIGKPVYVRDDGSFAPVQTKPKQKPRRNTRPSGLTFPASFWP